jgi:hypothetical protein
MNEPKKSFQPWNLLLILVCVVGFVGGVYLLNTTINARLDALDTAVTGGLGTMSKAVERIDTKVTDIQADLKVLEAKMAAPPPPPPPPAPIDPAAPPAAPPAPAKAE